MKYSNSTHILCSCYKTALKCVDNRGNWFRRFKDMGSQMQWNFRTNYATLLRH